MPEPEIFPNAPIKEALVDLRVMPLDDSDLSKLDPFVDRLSERFPIKEDRIEYTHKIGFDKSEGREVTHSKARKLGYVLFTQDRDWAVQGRLDGFTVSKMKPYGHWEELRNEAQELWNLYKDVVAPQSVIRLAVRYINRIELPLPSLDFDDYILTAPKIADDIPQGLSQFFFRLVISKPDDNITAIITSTLDSIEKETNVLPYIFDIDTFIVANYKPSSDEIWSDLDRLRDFKNLIFFNSMTDKAKDLFR